jgi:hypothetical protein
MSTHMRKLNAAAMNAMDRDCVLLFDIMMLLGGRPNRDAALDMDRRSTGGTSAGNLVCSSFIGLIPRDFTHRRITAQINISSGAIRSGAYNSSRS